ncbi:protein RALF-like 34 [Asparagus officinalis]|nr:protein RALF-like 34 [Asparagus officinalis]
MSLSSLLLLLLLLIAPHAQNPSLLARAQVEETNLTLEWPPYAHSMYPAYPFGAEEDDVEDPEAFGSDSPPIKGARRSLSWYRRRSYISYGALSANRIPCPPRSGRSYYTHNCYRASGPAHPYSRGCSRITQCRR